jgi:hypothetical protein
MKAIINMTTAFLLLLMFLFGWSLVTYNEDPQKYQWLDPNGEFKTSSYDVEVLYNLDTAFDELNGNSLNEVFGDNNEYNNGLAYTGLSLVEETNEYYKLEVTSTSTTSVFVRPDISYTSVQGDYIWHHSNFKMENTTYYQLRTYTGAWSSTIAFSDNEIHNDFRKVIFYSNTTYRFSVNSSGVGADWYLYKDDLVYINMTDLGIENLTEDRMNYWFSEYQRLQDNQIENYKELGSTVESSWQYLTGYFTTLVDIVDAQVQVILNPVEALVNGLSIITVPIFG